MTQSEQEMVKTLAWYGYLYPDKIVAHLAKEQPIPMGPEELRERLKQDPDRIAKDYYLPGFTRRMAHVDHDTIKARVLNAHDPGMGHPARCIDLGRWFAWMGATLAEVEAEVRGVDRSYECGCNLRSIFAGWKAARVEQADIGSPALNDLLAYCATGI